MKVNEIYKDKRPTFSFEIFPPKKTGTLESIYSTIDGLASLTPDFMSVTYGAGGSSRENTLEICTEVQNNYNIPALAHLTCIGSNKTDIDEILERLKENKVKNILALRGDLVGDNSLGDFRYASDLIGYIKERYDFGIVAGCYPEKHIEAYSLDQDIEHLKHKVSMGVDLLITQLFFDNNVFYVWLDKVRKAGINVPIVAGILPITLPNQLDRLVSLCGASVPEGVQRLIKAYHHNRAALKEAGIAYATSQIVDLLAYGVDGIHLYTMNQADTAQRIIENLRGILYSLKIKRA